MAGVILDHSGAQVTVGATYAAALQISAGNNQLLLKSLEFSFDDLTSPPLTIKITRGSDAGTGGVTATPVKRNPDQQHTVLTTGLTGPWATTEPTAGTELREFEIGPGGGTMFFGDDFVIGKDEKITVFVLHATATPKIRVNAELEE